MFGNTSDEEDDENDSVQKSQQVVNPQSQLSQATPNNQKTSQANDFMKYWAYEEESDDSEAKELKKQ